MDLIKVDNEQSVSASIEVTARISVADLLLITISESFSGFQRFSYSHRMTE